MFLWRDAVDEAVALAGRRSGAFPLRWGLGGGIARPEAHLDDLGTVALGAVAADLAQTAQEHSAWRAPEG